MTQDDVIQITRSLGICELTRKPKQKIHYSLTIHEMLEAFKLVDAKASAREREACAKVCDNASHLGMAAIICAEEIRARGETTLRGEAW